MDPMPHQLYPVASRAAALWTERHAHGPPEGPRRAAQSCKGAARRPLTVGRRQRRRRAFGQRSMPPAAQKPSQRSMELPGSCAQPGPYARSGSETWYIASPVNPMPAARGPVVAAGRAGKASSTSLFEDEENRGCDVPIEGKTRMVPPLAMCAIIAGHHNARNRHNTMYWIGEDCITCRKGIENKYIASLRIKSGLHVAKHTSGLLGNMLSREYGRCRARTDMLCRKNPAKPIRSYAALSGRNAAAVLSEHDKIDVPDKTRRYDKFGGHDKAS
ncbi:hypothetical protein B0H17DRAFT_1142158 [Mycena rosella]|uniref:Uncharacterized protein n=1 Tax=Mycena rosella TaxID=1033263 RepID=A0AAD7CYC6_MYCRO|nr:hypothetical protein B0H17DRAFT_1142158 [Mycena rosella]